VAKRPQTLQPGRGLAAQRVAVGRQDVRTLATPVVALSASSVRRADLRPIGQADVRCPRVRCPRVGCPRDRCHPGVRTDGPPVSAALQPRCPHRARPWNGSVRRASPLGAWVRRAAVVRGRRGRLPAWGLTGRDGAALPVGWLAPGSTADLGRIACAQAAAPPRRLADKGAGPAPGCRSVGWGAREQAGAHQSLRRVHPGQVAGVVPRPWGWTRRW
jgi:hypothetical protein